MIVVGGLIFITWADAASWVIYLDAPIVVTPRLIAAAILSVMLVGWLVVLVLDRMRQPRRAYTFCDAWLEYLKFIFLFITKRQAYELRKDQDFVECLNENRDEFRAFHDWRSKLRELLFKAGARRLCIAENQHWEKLKKESEVFQTQAYLTPFSFILDQTTLFMIATVHGEAAWAALHISEEFIERLAYQYPAVERLWKARERATVDALNDMDREVRRQTAEE